MKIRANGDRVLVKLLPAYDGISGKLGLTIIDKRKHFAHTVRRGVIESIGRRIDGISVGDVVVFCGDAGFSLDGDAGVEGEEFGEGYRWLRWKECLGVEEVGEV